MKSNLPYNILLGITILSVGIMAFCNLFPRESFAVTVRYDFPAVHRAGEAPKEPDSGGPAARAVEITPDIPDEHSGSGNPGSYAEDGPDEYEEYAEAAGYEENGAYAEADAAQENRIAVRFPLDINKATVNELKYIPGVGDVTSQRIVQYREYLGGYTSTEQLMEIKGIAEKTYENIVPYLYVEGEYIPADN